MSAKNMTLLYGVALGALLVYLLRMWQARRGA